MVAVVFVASLEDLLTTVHHHHIMALTDILTMVRTATVTGEEEAEVDGVGAVPDVAQDLMVLRLFLRPKALTRLSLQLRDRTSRLVVGLCKPLGAQQTSCMLILMVRTFCQI
jgi:hypothetical protein